MSKTAALVLLLAAVGGSLAQDYCSICDDHTMCEYPKDPGESCQPLLKKGVSHEQREEILQLHNDFRSKVTNGLETNGTNGGQPSSSNMRKLSWDHELAKVAQHWVDQCMYKHDTCRNVKRFQVGQNIAMTGSSDQHAKPEWDTAVNLWYDEVNKFDRDGIGSYVFDKNTGHYTQLVWAETYLVGCGYSKYPGQNPNSYTSFYACNYGPAGNVDTMPIYLEGVPCTNCPKGTEVCENSLCVWPVKPE